ncbi:response regulator [Kiritimatiellaeota bacterium B1221]|nr:response regulator [Kiritimatiellaeota bacterium B1221]
MQSKNILVVDDEPSIRSLYHIAFSHSGYEVRVASNGEDALEMLTEQYAEIIFLDLNLPGIKGDKLCRMILEKWPDTRMIAITGDLKPFGELECREAGFHHVLTKPIQLIDLLNAAQGEPE